MNNTLISIIVPAYNIDKYIGRCLESIINQDYKELEIIVVNDGSTDSTGEVINNYATIDHRIISICKENGGVSEARLVGLKRASGEYIGFVDGDDYIEPEMYSRLLSNAEKYDADISHCGYQMVFPNHIDYYYKTGKIVVQDKLMGIKDLLKGTFIEPGIWNKLYRKSLFDDILYKQIMPLDIRINEDLLMNYWLFKTANKSVYEDFCPYHYILRKGSAATSKLNEHKLKDPLKVMRIIIKDLENNPQAYEIAEERFITQLIGISVLPTSDQKELVKPFRKEIRNELRQNIFSIMSKPYIRKSVKIKTVWVSVWPASYRWIHNIYTNITGLNTKYIVE